MNTNTEPKIEGKEHFHGSDLEKIEEYFGIPKEQITGFGANVNPLGISKKMKDGLAAHIDAVTTYPIRNTPSFAVTLPATPDAVRSRFWWETDAQN